jgi:hypothetical protein
MEEITFSMVIYPGAPQAAVHYLANLVPFPETLAIAARFQGIYPLERLQSGLSALHALFADIYRAGVQTPEHLIPANLSTRQKRLKEPVFTAYPRLLFALGLYGKLDEENGQVLMQVELKDIADFCARAHIREPESFFKTLGKFGLFYLPSQTLQFSFPSQADLLLALVVFANACKQLTNKETNPPAEFLRADMRLLQINRKKIRQVPMNPEEAIRTLTDEEEAFFIRDVDAWARSAGYEAITRCTGVHKSEFIVSYQLPRGGHRLLGYRTESGELHMHINFKYTDRILPFIAQAPPAFRDLYYQRCTCAECHTCKDGPLQIILDGAERRLCRYSYMNLPQVPSQHFETIQSLLKTQDGILKEG